MKHLFCLLLVLAALTACNSSKSNPAPPPPAPAYAVNPWGSPLNPGLNPGAPGYVPPGGVNWQNRPDEVINSGRVVVIFNNPTLIQYINYRTRDNLIYVQDGQLIAEQQLVQRPYCGLTANRAASAGVPYLIVPNNYHRDAGRWHFSIGDVVFAECLNSGRARGMTALELQRIFLTLATVTLR